MIKSGDKISVKFNGGLNTQANPLAIEDNQSPNCKNVHSNMVGSLERRNGYTAVASHASGTIGNGLFDYWLDSNTHYLMSYMSTTLSYVGVESNSFNWTVSDLTLSTAMSDDVIEFDTFNDGGTNYLLMCTHSRDTMLKWDGDTSSTCSSLSIDSDTPKPKYIKVWKNRLWTANESNNESRITYNTDAGAIKDDGDWDSSSYIDILTYDGDYITGLAILKGRLYAFKRYSIHKFTYYGGTPLVNVKQAVDGVGTISSKSISLINHPRLGEVLVFLGADARFYAFDGSQIIPISVNIENDNGVSEFNLNRLNDLYLSNACAENYKEKHWYVCWVPTTTYNNWCVVYDYYNENWFPFTGMDARCVGLGEDAGERKLYFIQADGKIMQFDSGDDDNGSAITATYDTKKITYADMPALKKQRYLDLHFKNVGNYNMSLQRRSDWNNSWDTAQDLSMQAEGGFILGTSKLGTSLGGGEGTQVTKDLPHINHFEQFRFSTNSSDPAWNIFACELVGKRIGYGGVT